MSFLSRLAAVATAATFLSAGFALAISQSFTFPLVNQTGLDPSQYTLYAMGFSYNSGYVMTSDGTFVSQTSGTVNSYQVGPGGLTSITLNGSTTFTGGRLYFFVVPAGDPAPSVPYSTQPKNPPTAGVPPYTIVEITVPSPGANATVDVQTVDGFSFPITITVDGQTNVAGQQYGQPLETPSVNRAAIFSAYSSFMTSQGAAGAPYASLVYAPGSVAEQAGGILNPYAYLVATDTQNQFVNLASPLQTIWNSDLDTLFAATGLRVQGAASGDGDTPVIPSQSYTVTPVSQNYPNTAVLLPALQFTGETSASDVFYVFNPKNIAYLTNDSGTPITGSVDNATLTLDSTVTGLAVGMYVNGAGLTTSNGEATVQISAINGNTLTLSPAPSGIPTPHSQYQFCKLPYLTMFATPGQMVFGNTGVFADNTIQHSGVKNGKSTVLGSLENSLVSALNRGVALNPSALNPTTAGSTTAIWGDQRNWYPADATQNLFSLFMHSGQIGDDLIFFAPAGASSWPNARGQIMGAAYGFGFDENGGPVPPAPTGQPEVPSKFDQNIAQGSSITITFGPWTGPTPDPTPTPLPTPTVKIDGKKTIHTSGGAVKIQGHAVGDAVYVKYKAKPGKTVKKKAKLKADGKWIFKFKPKLSSTTLQIYSTNADGTPSKKQKVKVILEAH